MAPYKNKEDKNANARRYYRKNIKEIKRKRKLIYKKWKLEQFREILCR